MKIEKIASTAVIHGDVILAENIVIGHGTIIYPNVTIGENSIIEPYCIIGQPPKNYYHDSNFEFSKTIIGFATILGFIQFSGFTAEREWKLIIVLGNNYWNQFFF